MLSKVCIYCETSRPISDFPKHKQNKDRLDNRCKNCIKEQSSLRKQLHKEAPEKPEFCECCGKQPKTWHLDHDHSDNSFRGWLCDKCNTAIGILGDDLRGVTRAMNYLLSRNKS
jgi:hypothetical protein